ncbi:MAG TPA: metallophosphoesterase [Gammaproteobacteria bacterium]|nr:metallophosphoesterase [Gammaproteobacteria bacterium]
MRFGVPPLRERLLAACAGGVLALGAGAVVAPAHADEPRIVAIGDVHGAYDAFVALLAAAGLVDGSLDWSGGDARLVMLGDVLDRGPGSRRALELLIRLREQAARAGGDAQLVLGNHEVMNLLGDLAYVTPAELAAYVADEEPAEREAAWQRFRSAQPAGDEARLAAAFAERYPPGFFGHRAAFAPRGRIGAWLLQRPVLAVAGRTAFVHGGLPPAVVGKTADEINRAVGSALREYLAAVDTLREAGVLQVEMPFADELAAATAFLEVRARIAADPVRRAAERVRDFGRSPLLGGDAVFWYRGTAACNPALERGRLQRELRTLGVDRVIIGHTPTSDARVQTRFDGAVVRADTGMLAAYFRGRASAVVIRGDEVRVLYGDSGEELAPEPQPRTVGPRVRGLDDDALADFLATASVTARAPLEDGAERVRLERGGLSADAVFRPADAPRRGAAAALPEVAAYRLDRLLDLDLVPVTVRRELDGRAGSLQLPVDNLPDDRQRTAEQRSDAFCPLTDQINLMYVFDSLARHEGRLPAGIRYEPSSWQLVLVDNRDSFGAGADLPKYLRDVRIDVPEWLASRLEQLDRAALAESMGDVLDERQRAAILARRDRLTSKTAPPR